MNRKKKKLTPVTARRLRTHTHNYYVLIRFVLLLFDTCVCLINCCVFFSAWMVPFNANECVQSVAVSFGTALNALRARQSEPRRICG